MCGIRNREITAGDNNQNGMECRKLDLENFYGPMFSQTNVKFYAEGKITFWQHSMQ